ncbi:hypothetical protein, partial [Porphyromonas loveana]|uniref:hypothetical protein n=1 Tax=Porphyromonas loveana TaxID=1884669 RepID=UPI00359F14B9
QNHFLLAPFQKKLCAKSKNFWRELFRKTGAIFRPFLPHNFEKYVPQFSMHHRELKKDDAVSIFSLQSGHCEASYRSKRILHHVSLLFYQGNLSNVGSA